MSEWRPIADRPDFDHQPMRQFILCEGFKEHSGVLWNRLHADTAYIQKDGPFGYRREDIERIRKDGDMDLVEHVTHWSPCSFLAFPR